MELQEKDKNILINLMLEYSKENGFPFYEKIKNHNNTNTIIFGGLKREEYYKYLIKDYIEKQIENHSGSKMGKLFSKYYNENKKLFIEFCLCNINKKFDEKFNTLGEQVKQYLNIIEFELFKSIDNSQYKKFAGGVDNKYQAFLKSLFPYYNNIGVKVKNINS